VALGSASEVRDLLNMTERLFGQEIDKLETNTTNS
jgi:hypothetical protein